VKYEQTKDIKVLQVSCSDDKRYLPPTRTAIEAMKRSLSQHGQISPIGVHPVTRKTYRVIAGATRFRAASELNWKTIRASIWSGSAIDFELHELAENIERRELTTQQRKEMRAKMRDLQRKQFASVQPSQGGRGKKGGLRETARQTGVPLATAQRRQQEKLTHNTENGSVSDDAPPTNPTNDYSHKKHSIDWPMSLYRRITAWCEQENVNFSEGVRRIIRDRLDSDLKIGERAA
jgi:ParB/Sulfiredoxin domain